MGTSSRRPDDIETPKRRSPVSDNRKLSEELDEETLSIICRKMTYEGSQPVSGNCECCGAPITAGHYDMLMQTARRCQICRLLDSKKHPEKD